MGTSSGLEHVTLPVIGYYCSSKWAFEAIHESLAAEVKEFGIKVTIIEPGAYATEFGSQDSLKFAQGMDIYGDFKKQFVEQLQTMERGDPKATPSALFAVVDAAEPPLRFNLGSHNLPWIRARRRGLAKTQASLDQPDQPGEGAGRSQIFLYLARAELL